jgi:hypothetical protein
VTNKKTGLKEKRIIEAQAGYDLSRPENIRPVEEIKRAEGTED